MQRLEPTAPAEAVQLYLQDRKPEVTKNTHYEHKCRLTRFLEWCDETGLENMNEVTGRTAHEYKTYRAEKVAPATLENEMRTFRLFLRFGEQIDAVPEGVASKVSIPRASKEEKSRSVHIKESEADAILDYLEKFEYGSLRHVTFSLLWNLGMRTSGLRAIDLGDFHEDSPHGPYIEIKHRPESGTPLKNKWRGEREPPIRDETRDLILDYIEHHRHDVTDEYGREPLLTTENGRPFKTTVQRNIYGVTRPCHYTGECPHDREIEECEARTYNTASKCPSSVSPHAVRRGASTNHLNDGMPEEMVSDRLDMSPEVLREHYNEQTKEDKRKLQREFLNG